MCAVCVWELFLFNAFAFAQMAVVECMMFCFRFISREIIWSIRRNKSSTGRTAIIMQYIFHSSNGMDHPVAFLFLFSYTILIGE